MKWNNKSSTHKEIKKALIDADATLAGIARKKKVSRQFVHSVATGKRRTERIRRAIARAVGKRVEELWPSGPLNKAA